jgi:hypothetical protein
MTANNNWLELLRSDPRWKPADEDEAFIGHVETGYPSLNITEETHKFISWLQEPKGRQRKFLRRSFLNWLSNAMRYSRQSRSPGWASSSTRVEANNTQQWDMKEGW